MDDNFVFISVQVSSPMDRCRPTKPLEVVMMVRPEQASLTSKDLTVRLLVIGSGFN